MSESAATLAQLCNLIYLQVEGWDDYWVRDDVVIARSGNTLVLRGSVTANDWMRDADDVPEYHKQLGWCHKGFLTGMDDVFAEVRNSVAPGVNITGHSLGGARARLLAGLFAVNGIQVGTLCVFGSPKPAAQRLVELIQASGMQHVSYRNNADIVPTLPPFGFVHTEEWTLLKSDPAVTNFASLRDHSMDLYCAALAVS